MAGLRFVNDMLAAGTAEEVLRLAAASVPRDQWAGLLRSLNVDTTETDSIRFGESEEVTQLQEQLAATSAAKAQAEAALRAASAELRPLKEALILHQRQKKRTSFLVERLTADNSEMMSEIAPRS